MKFSKELRRRIIEEFASRHGGYWNAELFVQEVRAGAPGHPAYEWFEWDDTAAAHQHRVDQARRFREGLVIRVEIKDITPRRGLRVDVAEVPLVLSPVANRGSGGGYYCVDRNNPEHMRELCRQGADDLERWLRRYKAAVVFANGEIPEIERAVSLLRHTGMDSGEAA